MLIKSNEAPSLDSLLAEAKASENGTKCGMFLTHCGVVRVDARSKVREGNAEAMPVCGMRFSYDEEKVNSAIEKAYHMNGIYHIRVWLANGSLKVGDDIMRVLVGGDIRPNVIECLNTLVGEIKSSCVSETELY